MAEDKGNDMKIADMHCDTISEIYKLQKKGRPVGLKSSHLQVDTEKMIKSGYILQNFAAYVNLAEIKNPFAYCNELIDCFYQEMEVLGDTIRVVRNYSDIEENLKAGKISAMLTIEEGGVCLGNLSLLRNFYRLGVRMMTLTWNYRNELAYPNLSREGISKGKAAAEERNGLTETGVLFVQEMERLGMIIDVSHLGDAGFWDVIKYTSKPFAASHSNCRTICPHPRNLTDEMLEALSHRGGVAGLNYYHAFVRETPQNKSPLSRVADLAAHARHMADVGGIECIGLGSDYDGIDDNVEMKSCGEMELLFEGLKEAGFHESEIDCIFYKNVLRLYKDLLSSQY